MITRQYREPRGLDEATRFGFYVRVSGDTHELLKNAKRIAAERPGGAPSNALLFDEMLRAYLNDTKN
jgi:hypothetical protein